MRTRVTYIAGLFVLCLAGGQPCAAPATTQDTPLASILERLDDDHLQPVAGGAEYHLQGLNLRVRQCGGYPYSIGKNPALGTSTLVSDLREGLETGLQCLGGTGPAGRLHPYHEYQADRLLELLGSERRKTFQCVEDAMFATAVATGPKGVSATDPLYAQLRQVQHPAVLLDTYRLGGVLSRRHNDETYRSFFHLEDDQILEHRSGQPLRPPSLHRYQNRPGLLFHEMIHWLGHEHSALYPDVAHLYETCCFGGSDYIADPQRNEEHRQTACNILKDDALWSQGDSPYRQMRIWHFKAYDRLKTRMRADYDS